MFLGDWSVGFRMPYYGGLFSMYQRSDLAQLCQRAKLLIYQMIDVPALTCGHQLWSVWCDIQLKITHSFRFAWRLKFCTKC